MTQTTHFNRMIVDTEANLPTLTSAEEGLRAYCKDTNANYSWTGAAWMKDSTGGASIPAGLIAMWSGLLANIPSGWILCDGTGGTPDLRSKFVKGAAAGIDPGVIGGNLTHTHAQHPALTHSGGSCTVGAHTNVVVPATATAAVKIGTSTAAAAAETHTHTIASITHAVTHGDPSQHAAQSHDTPNHEPPYYSVAYIMKT